MHDATIYLASILVLGIVAQWLAWRLRVPAILLLLGLGFALGVVIEQQQVEQWVGQELLFSVVSLSVAVILFEGGMSLKLSELRARAAVVRLVTVGVVVTWILTALAVWWIFDLDAQLATLAGAILVVSGPTVIVPLLRHMRPSRNVGAIVKWEGIVNDPIGAVLAVLVFEAISGGAFGRAAGEAAGGLLLTAGVGVVVGLAASWLLVELLRRYWVPDYLHSAFFLAVVIAAHSIANAARNESGLVAVTLLGILVANQRKVVVTHILEFKENLRVLLISALFVVLASRVELADLWEFRWRGPALLAAMILVIRPLAVLASTIGSSVSWRERLLLGWLAPRGIVAAAVSSLFALEIASGAGDTAFPPAVQQQAHQLVPITFLVIVGTVTIYGLTSAPLARLLGLSRQNPQGILFAGAAEWIREIAAAVSDLGFDVLLVDTNYPNIAAARMRGLPTCYASILSEYVHEEHDLAGLGRLLALTPNDEVNSLAAIAFADHFSRAEVYQLARPKQGSQRRTPTEQSRPGRELFGENVSHAHLSTRIAAGAKIKITKLSDDFTLADFRARYGENALILMVADTAGLLRINTTAKPLKPEPGDRVISLVDAQFEGPSESSGKARPATSTGPSREAGR